MFLARWCGTLASEPTVISANDPMGFHRQKLLPSHPFYSNLAPIFQDFWKWEEIGEFLGFCFLGSVDPGVNYLEGDHAGPKHKLFKIVFLVPINTLGLLALKLILHRRLPSKWHLSNRHLCEFLRLSDGSPPHDLLTPPHRPHHLDFSSDQ